MTSLCKWVWFFSKTKNNKNPKKIKIMKKKILNVLKVIGYIILFGAYSFGIYYGSNMHTQRRDREDKQKFEQLKHGETINTNSQYVYEVIHHATDSITLWDKKYKCNTHVLKKDKNIIAWLYGSDTLTIYIEERIHKWVENFPEYWYIDITKK